MNIEHYQRNELNRTLTFLDSSDNPVDLTGGSVLFVLKDEEDSPTPTISETITVTSQPENGVVNLVIPGAQFDIDPGEYFYEVALVLGGRTTVLKGVFTIKASLIA